MIIAFFLLTKAFAGTLCNDGWVSPSEGSGTCSHHGGVSVGVPTPAGMSSSTGWVYSTGVTNAGAAWFSIKRADESVIVDLSCYAYAPMGWGITIALFSPSGGDLVPTFEHRVDAADGTTPLNIFVRKGDLVERIASWDVYADHTGPLMMSKSLNIMAPVQAGGVLYLTEEDLAKIERADLLHISVYIGEDTTTNLHSYKVDMTEVRTLLPSMKERCTAASAVFYKQQIDTP